MRKLIDKWRNRRRLTDEERELDRQQWRAMLFGFLVATATVCSRSNIYDGDLASDISHVTQGILLSLCFTLVLGGLWKALAFFPAELDRFDAWRAERRAAKEKIG